MYGNDCTTDQVEKHVLWGHVPKIMLQGVACKGVEGATSLKGEGGLLL